ncbi:hypothetical protein LTR08_002085 [Meristemomyces frigidus]|nr:hypothetical protein LTR08_002085 [Meristemomyces frigidus]
MNRAVSAWERRKGETVAQALDGTQQERSVDHTSSDMSAYLAYFEAQGAKFGPGQGHEERLTEQLRRESFLDPAPELKTYPAKQIRTKLRDEQAAKNVRDFAAEFAAGGDIGIEF